MKQDFELLMKNRMWDIFQNKLGYDLTDMRASERSNTEVIFNDIIKICVDYINDIEDLNDYHTYALENNDLRDEINDLEQENKKLKEVICSVKEAIKNI